MGKSQGDTAMNPTRTLEKIPLHLIIESKLNPRDKQTPDELSDLCDSIVSKGLLQPISVRPDGDGYEILDGHRRFWAYEFMQMETILAFIVEIDRKLVPEYQLVCNLQREDLHPMKLAELYATLTAGDRDKIHALATQIGKKPQDVHQILNLVNLTKQAKALFLKDSITIDHAILLCKMTPDDQEHAMDFFLSDQEYGSDAIKSFKKWIDQEITFSISNAPWDKSDGELIPGVVACDACPKNSAFNISLFPDAKGKGFCGDRACFKAKLEAYKVMMHKKARKEEGLPFILISTSHSMSPDEPMKIKDVKLSGRYVIVKDGKECENTKRAQWIDGPSHGKFTKVCNYSKCPKHFKGSGPSSSVKSDDYNSPVQRAKRKEAEEKLNAKRELDYKVTDAVVDAIIKKLPAKCSTHLLREVAIVFNTVLYLDLDVRESFFIKGNVDDYIDKAKDASLVRIIIAFIISNDVGDAVDPNEAHRLNSWAKHLKIDTEAIRKRITDQAAKAEKSAAPRKDEKAGEQKKAKK